MNVYHLYRRLVKEGLDTVCFLALLPSCFQQRTKIKKKTIHKILCINLQGIGDILMTTPLLTALRKEFPHAEIDYCCYKENGILLEGDKRINKLIKRQENDITGNDFWKTLQRIKEERYDLVINIFPAQHSALLTVLSKAKYKMGNLWSATSTTNNLAVKKTNATWDMRENCKNIAEQLEIAIEEPFEESIEIQKDMLKKTRKKVQEEIKGKKVIVMNPYAQWIAKEWPMECWKELLERILKRKEYQEYIVAIIGTEKERQKTEEFLEQVKIKTERVRNWAGRWTLPELAAVLKDAELLVTTDTGPMHIACAVKTKTIGLFGVTDPNILVRGAKNIEIISVYDQCPKKFQFNHNNEPPDWKQSCMKKIAVDELLKKMRQ